MSPPVDDSAMEMVSLRSLRRAPTVLPSVWSCDVGMVVSLVDYVTNVIGLVSILLCVGH
jgi:hypothetical protein